jgi:hypothetical protein
MKIKCLQQLGMMDACMQLGVMAPEVSQSEAADWGNALEDALIDGSLPTKLTEINMHFFHTKTVDNAIGESVGAELASRSFGFFFPRPPSRGFHLRRMERLRDDFFHNSCCISGLHHSGAFKWCSLFCYRDVGRRCAGGDIPLIAAAVAMIMTFTCLALFVKDTVHSKLTLAIVAVATVALSIGSAFGLSLYLQIPFTSLSQVRCCTTLH